MLQYHKSSLKTFDIPAAASQDAWLKVQRACTDQILTDWGLKTLSEGLGNHVSTVLLEPSYVCKDYRNIYSHFYSKKFVPRPSKCSRLHFFGASGLTVQKITSGDQKARDSYIGFSVLQPVINNGDATGLGRTIIDPIGCGNDPKKFYCLQTRFGVHIQGVPYEVRGFPWMAQSGEAIVCAHTALWSVCRYLSERYHEYGEVYPYNLIEMTGDTGGRRVPYRGMLYTDYSTILSTFGCHPVIITPKTFHKPDWTKDKSSYLNIYSYVESGFPILASFSGHVAVVVGHTSRQNLAFDSPDPNGFHDSYALLDQYVVIDGNYFPYQRLGNRVDGEDRNYGTRFAPKKSGWQGLVPHPSKEDIYAVVVPLPEKAFMPPDTARSIGSKFFQKFIMDVEDAVDEAGGQKGDKLITRLFLTSSNAFKKRKKESAEGTRGKPPDLLSQFPLRLDLPHFIWVIEISPLPLYNAGLAVGEVVLDASADKFEVGLIYGRIGDQIVFQGKKSPTNGAPCSFRQFTHNLGER